MPKSVSTESKKFRVRHELCSESMRAYCRTSRFRRNVPVIGHFVGVMDSGTRESWVSTTLNATIRPADVVFLSLSNVSLTNGGEAGYEILKNIEAARDETQHTPLALGSPRG